jgi:hypothetical protein
MQGGRKEIGLTEVGKKGAGRPLPVRVDEITISPAADAALAKLRGLFLQAVSLPMCWLCVSSPLPCSPAVFVPTAADADALRRRLGCEHRRAFVASSTSSSLS